MNNDAGQLVVTVKHCARCGEDHENLIFSLLANPQDEWKYWALCPDSHQPVLLKVTEDQK